MTGPDYWEVPRLPITRMMTRFLGFLSILAVLAVSGYAFFGKTSVVD